MNANELRIGNIIYFSFIREKVEVVGIALKDNELYIQTKLNNTYFFESPAKYKPIPLTEEWLLKFGFEKTDDYGDIQYYALKNSGKRHYYVCFNHDDISFGLCVFGNCTSLIYDDVFLQHIHQLQNLYFALTGEELNENS